MVSPPGTVGRVLHARTLHNCTSVERCAAGDIRTFVRGSSKLSVNTITIRASRRRDGSPGTGAPTGPRNSRGSHLSVLQGELDHSTSVLQDAMVLHCASFKSKPHTQRGAKDWCSYPARPWA